MYCLRQSSSRLARRFDVVLEFEGRATLMRRCTLHFGTPKTGSTTIQRFLGEHGRSLLRFGCLVPRTGTGPGGSHFPIARTLSRQAVPARYLELPAALLQEVSKHPGTDIVLTSELLDDLFRQHPIDNPVISFFRRSGFEVTLVGYFRNQPQRINSGYAQAVKSLKTNISFNARVNRNLTAARFDYRYWIGFAADNGCRLVARPFNKPVRTAGIVEDFLATIGVTDHGLKLDTRSQANRSPGPCALAAVQEVMCRAKERGHRWTHRQRFRAMRLLAEVIDDPRYKEAPFCGLDTETARRIQSFYKAPNDEFAGLVWGTDWDTVFKEDVEATFERNVFDPATASPEAKERYAEMLDRLWSGMQAIMDNPRLRKEPETLRAELD